MRNQDPNPKQPQHQILIHKHNLRLRPVILTLHRLTTLFVQTLFPNKLALGPSLLVTFLLQGLKMNTKSTVRPAAILVFVAEALYMTTDTLIYILREWARSIRSMVALGLEVEAVSAVDEAG